MSNKQDDLKGRCVSCGFAAKRTEYDPSGSPNPEYFEIPLEERSGCLTLSKNYRMYGSMLYFKTDIACFRGKLDLVSLVNDCIGTANLPGGMPEHAREGTRELISKQILEETGCDAWYQYESGRTPQEHLTDLMWERLEEQRQHFEHEREAERRAFEERLEKERREFDAGLSEKLEKDRREWIATRDEARDIDQKRNDSLMKKLTLAAVILGLAQVIAAVLALTKDSWIVQLFCKWFAG